MAELIYLDHNATTPCAPEVIAAMQRFWAEDFANPASKHLSGRRAANAVNAAREQVASSIKCNKHEIFFTSGATESNNMIFLGLLLSGNVTKKKIVVSALEHKSVAEAARFLGERGFDVVFLPSTPDGVVDVRAAEREVNTDTALVSVQTVNNEIGTIQPIQEIAALSHNVGAMFHTDAVQALGKIPINMYELGCDFASFSAHKLYGPKGIGALYVRGGAKAWPWPAPFKGGGQEGGLRPGTSNVPAIVGFGVACMLARERTIKNSQYLRQLRDFFEDRLRLKFSDCIIHGSNVPRVAGTTSVSFPGVPGDFLVDNLASVSVGNGSACSDGALTASPILLSLGLSHNIAKETVRISFGIDTTTVQVEVLLNMIKDSVSTIRGCKGNGYKS